MVIHSIKPSKWDEFGVVGSEAVPKNPYGWAIGMAPIAVDWISPCHAAAATGAIAAAGISDTRESR